MGSVPLISYSEFIVILLTALAVLLTALAIGIGVCAIFGYTALRDGVREAARKQVTEVMTAKMREYPDANKMIELGERLVAVEAAIGGLDQLKNKIVTGPAPKEVAAASNSVVQEQAEQSAQIIPSYPEKAEKEARDASTTGARNSPAKPDSGRNNS